MKLFEEVERVIKEGCPESKKRQGGIDENFKAFEKDFNARGYNVATQHEKKGVRYNHE